MNSSPDISAIVDFSRHLRDAREFRGISTAEVESITNISAHQIDALEGARWDEIPSGFVRGYLGMYAEAVGMNRAKVLREYDEMMSGAEDVGRAELVSSRPLLSQPQQIGMTRAKIAAAWFAELTARTRLKVVVTVLVALAVILVPLWIRSTHPSDPEQVRPALQSIEEYRGQTRGPLTVLLLPEAEPDAPIQAASSRILVVAGNNGVLRYHRMQLDRGTLAFSSLDTIEIQHLGETRLQIQPERAAQVFPPEGSRLDSVSMGNTARYTVSSAGGTEPQPASGATPEAPSGH